MKFKLNPNPTFEAAISLTVPGQAEPVPVRFTFAHMGRKALQAWMDEPVKAKAAGQDLADFDAPWLGKAVQGWHADDIAEPFTAENFARLLEQYPSSGTDLYVGFVRALTESRAKN